LENVGFPEAKKSDHVVLITDGFLEWENNGGEPFGADRLSAIIRQLRDREPGVIIAELYDSVLKFAEGTLQQDDLTAVLIKRSSLSD
jgi:sigma-B regulation protein RsbU (phosphoserine phosphatase)